MHRTTTANWERKEQGSAPLQRRNLVGACLAHVLHDGYTDQLYALLPIWQSEYGLSYAGLAVVRALYSGTMGGLQVPADKLAAKLSSRFALAMATFIAAAGYLVMSLPFGFTGLCIGLILAGVGSSVQHPRASLLVTNTYGKDSLGALGIYNFAGDLGKATFPAIVALLLTLGAWRAVVGVMSLIGLLVSVTLLVLVPQQPFATFTETAQARRGDGRGFNLLLAIGAFDTATRMGYLLFLPFLLNAKGGGEASLGIGLALLFAGGALGKACCGWLGQRFGIVSSVIVTEATTALFMVATLASPLWLTLVILPFVGIVLNGTSSVLYGDRTRTGTEGRGRPGLRVVLHGRPWRWSIGANRIRCDCGPFQ
jgi:MFS transporter, FSR family, fosmidomycin resistance protein